jgi:XTP/dITP diphosphohydrolase
VTAVRRLAAGARLVIATHNGGKLREIADLLAPHGVGAVSAGALGLPEPDETAADFVGNARLKAHAAAAATGLPALADDSGLCAAGLGGAPGVVSARWAGPEKDFSAAMARMQRELGTNPDRRAAFVCALALAWPDGACATFYGRVEGTLTWPPRGSHGFGYDPMFVPLGRTETFGEMAPAAKHALSHRARAFAQFVAACLP